MTAHTPSSTRRPIVGWLRPDEDHTPLVDQAPPMTLGEVFRRFWPQVRPLRWWLALALLLIAAAPLIEVIEIMLFQRLVDTVLVPADLRPLAMIALLYVGLNLLNAVISGCDDYLATWISQRFLVPLRTQVFRRVLEQPSAVSDRNRLGDVMSRLTSDVAAVESFMIGQLTSGVASVISLLIYVAALFYLQWQLAAVSLIAVPLLYWVATRFARLVKEVSRERRRRAGSLSAVTEESLSNASLVQAYNREDLATEDYHRQNLAIARAELVGSRIRAVFLPIADLAELVGTLAVIGMGTWALATDRLTLGGLLAFLALLVQCFRPLRELADLIPSLFSATAGVERIVQLMDEEVPTDRPGAAPLVAPRGDLELRGVRVRYPGATYDALDGLDLSVAAGEVIALVGPSGSGKSTVARLLTRHLDPSAGSVHLDGHDLRNLTRTSLREAVTVLPQETALMDASVEENIVFARPEATREQVEEALRQAGAADFVARLPQGLDTRLGQRGRSLSGGQRQRIALARAFLRDSPVLLLDEPTTGLDTATSERLLETLLAARAGRTIVIATHDSLVIDQVDRVVELTATNDLETKPC